MDKKLIRRIIAWIGLVGAVGFAPLLVLNFYDFGDFNSLIDNLLWLCLAITIIAFGLAKYILSDRPSLDESFADASEGDDCEDEIEDGEQDIPDGESGEVGENKDNDGSEEISSSIISSEEKSD